MSAPPKYSWREMQWSFQKLQDFRFKKNYLLFIASTLNIALANKCKYVLKFVNIEFHVQDCVSVNTTCWLKKGKFSLPPTYRRAFMTFKILLLRYICIVSTNSIIASSMLHMLFKSKHGLSKSLIRVDSSIEILLKTHISTF